MSDLKKSEFERSLEILINISCMENGSATPDFILARYLITCLEAFNSAVIVREKWYDREPKSSRIDLEPADV